MGWLIPRAAVRTVSDKKQGTVPGVKYRMDKYVLLFILLASTGVCPAYARPCADKGDPREAEEEPGQARVLAFLSLFSS